MTTQFVRGSLLLCAGTALVALGTSPARAGPLTANGTQPTLTNALSTPDYCVACHGDYDPANHIEPYPTWAGSMKAQAGRDPLFWASLDVANHDIPSVGDFCLRCHAPRGWLAGRSEAPGGSEDGCSMIGKMDAKNADDLAGVACAFCHRMKVNPSPPTGQLSVYEENGQFWLDEDSCAGEPCRYGPYEYPKDGTAEPQHVWAFSTYHESGQICGNCHNVTHPAKNLIVAGADTGVPFPVERTHREWEQSDYSLVASTTYSTCQNCHMPDATVTDAKACGISPNTHTGDLPIHELAGGNAWIPEVIRLEYPNLGVDQSLSATRTAALRMLQQESATLELTVAPNVNAGDSLPVQVKVTNLTGHKLPTGYPEGRRMWLGLSVRDADGAVVFESGAYDDATGTLTHDAQLKIYEAKVGIWNYNGDGKCDVKDKSGKPLFHFVLNDCIVSDNRIPPKGFVGGQDLETKPVGYTYPETSPGSGTLVSYDVTDFSVPIPASVKSPLTVEVKLRYQTTSKEYVEFLRDEAVSNAFPADCIEREAGKPTKSRGELLYDMWQKHGRSAPVDMAEESASVSVQGTAGTGGAAGSAGSAGSAGAGAVGGGGAAGGGAGGAAGSSGSSGSNEDDSGCGCRVAGEERESSPSGLVLLAFLLLYARRRRELT
jgi:MYXO-CTERM domain-containing protein